MHLLEISDYALTQLTYSNKTFLVTTWSSYRRLHERSSSRL